MTEAIHEFGVFAEKCRKRLHIVSISGFLQFLCYVFRPSHPYNIISS
jgi:hypothetical protein